MGAGANIICLKTLNGHENVVYNIFFRIKTGKTIRGHDFTQE